MDSQQKQHENSEGRRELMKNEWKDFRKIEAVKGRMKIRETEWNYRGMFGANIWNEK